jgi:dCTP deaminase
MSNLVTKTQVPYGLLPDWAIKAHVKIEPWSECAARPGVISYGVSSYGYDVRLGKKFKLFSAVHAEGLIVDPKALTDKAFVTVEADHCIIPPNHYALGETVEYFDIPRDVTVVCVGKSSYARAGVIVNVTPLEAEWRGHVTLEISNSTPLPVKLYAGEGICQMLFFRAEAPCDVSYADKRGVYQGQTGLTLPRVRGES